MPKHEKKSIPIWPFTITGDQARAMNTGEESPKFADALASREELAFQSAEIVRILKQTGRDLQDKTADAFVIGEHSFCMAPVERYKASRFIPVVDSRDRRPLRNGLTYWLQTEGPKHVRFAVITSGSRVPFGGDLKERWRFLTKLVASWSRAASTKWGVKVHFRGIEYTISAAGVHLHANVLYSIPRWFPPVDWADFLKWCKANLGVHWGESGELKSVSEVIKYMVKPADLLKPWVTADRLAWLYDQTRHARYMAPLSDFKRWWAEFDKDHKALFVTSRDGPGKVNHYLAKVEKHKRVATDKRDVAIGDDNATEARERHKAENVLICRGNPQARFSAIFESSLLVLNPTLNPESCKGRDRLKRMFGYFVETAEIIAQKRFEAARVRLAPLAQAGESEIRVHTLRLSPHPGQHVWVQDCETNQAIQTQSFQRLPLRVDEDYRVIHTSTGEILYDPDQDNPRQAAWLAERRRRRGEVTPREAREIEMARLLAARVQDGVAREVTWQEQVTHQTAVSHFTTILSSRRTAGRSPHWIAHRIARSVRLMSLAMQAIRQIRV
jgi:hypothetical protein